MNAVSNRFRLLVQALIAGLLLSIAGSLWGAEQFDIEILVFRNLAGTGDEAFPQDPGLPDPVMTMVFDKRPPALVEIAQRLRRSGNYQLLQHRAWRQPGLSPSRAKAVPMSNAERPEVGTLAGSITINRRRYLHAKVDLRFDNFGTGEAVRMRQSRRMRSGELHYIDNPSLGVLILATPVAGS